MSQGHSNKTVGIVAGDHHDKPPLAFQEKLSARQAKRAAKAAERRQKSEALKEQGNAFFRNGEYQKAADKYRQAIRVHGPSVKPILLTNLAAAYHNLGMFPEAHQAADDALTGDPKSVKARYRRAMARKNMETFSAAAIDFRIILQLDPRYQEEIEKELAYVEECRRENWLLEEDYGHTYSEDEAPAMDDNPELGESLSESSDCEHVGNGKPCKLYNNSECTKGRACPFSHAPDYPSERDALGRNVCRYYLMGLCRFGERCHYLHSKEHLFQKGWWSTAEGVDKAKRLYKVQQTFKKAAIEYEKQNESSANHETQAVPRKKRSKRKKRGCHLHPNTGGLGSGVATIVGSSRKATNTSAETNCGVDSYSSSKECNSHEGDDEYMFGFTNSQMNKLLCHGVKPWDDDAWDFLEALHVGYKGTDAMEVLGENQGPSS